MKPRKRMGILSSSIMIPLASAIDVIQVVLDVMGGIGVLINRILDIAMLGIIAMWMILCRVFSFRPWVALVVGTISEEIPLVDAAPLWVLDVIYIIRRVHKEDAKFNAENAAKNQGPTQEEIQQEAYQKYQLMMEERRRQEDEDNSQRRAA